MATPHAGPAESELLIELARHVSQFMTRMFRIQGETAERRDFLLKRQLVYKMRLGWMFGGK